MRRARIALALALAAAALAGGARSLAQELPIASGARSLEVSRSGVIVRSAPSVHSKRRGTVRRGTRLPLEARVRGEGCPGGEWYRVGPEQFVCESLVVPSAAPPFGEAVPAVAPGETLPRRYAFVAVDGTWSYRRPADYFQDEWAESLGEGFGIAITDTSEAGGVRFARSARGLWIPTDQLRFARGSDFEGVEIEEGRLDVAWARHGGASVRRWDGRRAREPRRRLGARERVRVLEELPGRLVRIAEDEVVSARELVRPTLAARAEGVGDDEVWIDVELATQTLLVRRGDRPVFATLVSTGRAGPAHRTPVGVHRVWVKLAEDTMDDLERTEQETNYAIEGVPWVQYFSEGVALHAAFWHDDFGRVRSHGCVNLAPRDARRIFGMTEPRLPDGWDAILATDAHPGSVVRVR